MADAGHDGCGFAREQERREGRRLVTARRCGPAFHGVVLTWTVERSFARPGRNRRLSSACEHRIRTSETMIDTAAARLMPTRLAAA